MIRPATADDFQAASRLLNDVWPARVTTLAGFRYRYESAPPEARRAHWVAEEDSEVVGWGIAGLNHETTTGSGFVSVSVRADRRRRGLGSALMERGLAHLADAPKVLTDAEGEGGRAFVEAHGFRYRTSRRISAVDPRTVAPLEPPPGVTLVTLAELDARSVYEVDAATAGDVPNEEPIEFEFEQWRLDYWENPDRDLGASFAGCVDGRPVAVCYVRFDADRGRAETDYTATLREFRGRGLARLVKTAALGAIAERGGTLAVTVNDESNAPMLAVNEALGYRLFVTEHQYER